jgi:hypothetical protein
MPHWHVQLASLAPDFLFILYASQVDLSYVSQVHPVLHKSGLSCLTQVRLAYLMQARFILFYASLQARFAYLTQVRLAYLTQVRFILSHTSQVYPVLCKSASQVYPVLVYPVLCDSVYLPYASQVCLSYASQGCTCGAV